MASRFWSVRRQALVIRACGVTALVACLLFVVGTAVQMLVPVPDSFVFDPAVTHPQFVHSVILPILWVLSVTGFWVGLCGLWLRDRRAYDSLRHVLAIGSGVGLGLVALAYLGFAAGHLNDLAGNGDELTGLVNVLVFLAGVALAAACLVLYGVVLAIRGPTKRVGVALVSGFLVAVVALSAWDGGSALLVVGFGVLGYTLAREPAPFRRRE